MRCCTSSNCPQAISWCTIGTALFEEMTHFTLLDRKFHILASRALGATYESWLLTGIEASGDDCFEATFGDRDNWRITLRPWGLRHLYPRIVLRRLGKARVAGS